MISMDNPPIPPKIRRLDQWEGGASVELEGPVTTEVIQAFAALGFQVTVGPILLLPPPHEDDRS